MASIKVDIREVIYGLSNIRKKIDDMSPFFKSIADMELAQTKIRYRNQEDPSGKKWPDPITIRRDGSTVAGRGQFTREQSWNYVLKSNFHAAPPGWHFFDKSRGDKVLRDTGKLYQSLGRDYGTDYAIVGTNTEYSDKLQSGRFPFLGINERTQRNISKSLKSYIRGILK